MQVYDKGYGNPRLGMGRVRGALLDNSMSWHCSNERRAIPQRTKMTCGHRAHSGVCAMEKEGQGRRKHLYVRTSAPNSSRESDMGT